MKKTVFYFATFCMLFVFSSCNRWRVRHDHSKKMEYVRLATDSMQKNDFEDADSWQDEPLLDIPDIPGEAGGHPDASGAERMFREGY
mgnify:CR=1 FL=1